MFFLFYSLIEKFFLRVDGSLGFAFRRGGWFCYVGVIELLSFRGGTGFVFFYVFYVKSYLFLLKY